MRLSEISVGQRVVVAKSYYGNARIIGRTGIVHIVGCFNVKVKLAYYMGDDWVAHLDIEPLVSPEVWNVMNDDEQKAYVEKYQIVIGTTSSIAETLESGFGDHNFNGFWEYQCRWYVPIEK